MTRHRAIITGATGGLGVAFARALAPHAGTLVLTGRRASALESLSAELAALHPHLEVRNIACDVLERAGRQALLQAATEVSAPIDLLINSAGINDFFPGDTDLAAAVDACGRQNRHSDRDPSAGTA